MRKLAPAITLIILLFASAMQAQAPNQVNYQAVVRDASGNPLPAGTNVSVRFQIHDQSAAGTIVFTESTTAITNQFGLITLALGAVGDLSTVNWGSGAKYLQVLIDPAGGSNFSDMGSTQLLSVPYALFAGNSAGASGATGAVGPTGPAGPNGSAGPQGPQGPVGAQGATGPQGGQGVQGPQGAPGVAGATGLQGVQGSTGVSGPQGIQGPAGPTGATGNQGLLGATGATGAQGIRGATGQQGIQGVTGNVGPQGVQGNTGPTGVQGVQGPIGVTGSTGSQGLTGNQGATGAQGIQGITGINGATGNNGATGATGAQGTQGIAGSTGAAGAQGVTGATGPQGVQGATGAQGIQGVAGNTGATGNNGLQGATGAAGSAGAQGATGAQGVQGVAGVTGTTGITGNTGPQGATGSQGTQGVAGVTGAVGATGAQGATGSAGAQGQQGLQGVTGATGNAGPQGATGANGGTGAQGVQGATGNNGLQGTTGVTGSTGSQGPQGFQGAQGVTGSDGATGAVGSTGPQGNNGAPGNTGATGPSGVTGADGAQGVAGTNGNDGATGATGVTGNDGVQGPTGSTGDLGLQGPTGEQGPIGVTGATGLLPDGTATGNTTYWNGTQWVTNSNFIYNDGINIAMGSNASATNSSIAIGGSASASGTNSFAEGFNSNAQGPGSAALAGGSAQGSSSVALGTGSVASGSSSVALGGFNTSSGQSAAALGVRATAAGNNSTAVGFSSNAGGTNSLAVGNNTAASGNNSSAIGFHTTASGTNASAMGAFTTAPSYAETDLGISNTTYTPASDTSWVGTDRLLDVGNGNFPDQNDALVILKNGNTGINTATPTATLDVAGTTRLENYTNGLLTVDANGNLGVASGSGNYILNGTSQQPASNFNISGNGTIGQTLQVGTFGTITSPGGGSFGSIVLGGAAGGYYGVTYGLNSSAPIVMYDGGGNGGMWEPSLGQWASFYNLSTQHFTFGNNTDYGATLGVNGTGYFSGNVSIGTGATAAKLDVESSTSPAFKLADGTQANGYLLTSDGAGNATWQAPTVGSTLWDTINGTNMINLNTGSVELVNGLIVSGVQLHQYGASPEIMANGDGHNGGGIAISDDGGFYDFNDGWVTYLGGTGLKISGNSGVNSPGLLYVQGDASITGNLQLQNLFGGYLTVDGNGNVLTSDGSGNFIVNGAAQQIGANFNIDGTGTVGNLLVNGTANGVTPAVGDSSTQFATTAFVAHALDSASANYIANGTSLQTGANFNIDGNGYFGGNAAIAGTLGVGTNNAQAQLDVAGNILFENYTSGLLAVDGSGFVYTTNGSGLFTAGSGLAWSGNTLNSVWSGTTNTGDLSYSSGTAVMDLTDNYGGLHVEGKSGGEASIALQPDNVANGAAGQWILYTSGSQLNNPNDFAVFNSSTGHPNMVMQAATGNVGIGTNNPSSTLEVNGALTVTNGDIQLNSTSRPTIYPAGPNVTGDADMQVRSEGIGTLQLNNDMAGNIEMVNGGGNVGIGVTSPAVKLDVSGDIHLNGHVQITDGTQQNGYVLTSNANGNATWRAPASVTGTTNQIDVTSNTVAIDPAYTAAIKAGFALTGGGNITYTGGELTWSQRFIVIDNGNGSHFSVNGYFDIGLPSQGTSIPGIGGAGGTTVDANGIALSGWQALYYILPVGSDSYTQPGNFVIAQYSNGTVIPENWILLALVNGDDNTVRLGTGAILQPGQTWTSGGGMAQSLGALSASYIQNGTSQQASSNFNISGNGIVGGDFGVGVSSPVQALDVNGTGLFRNGNTGNSQLAFGYGHSPDYQHGIKTRHNGGAAQGNDIDFYLWTPTDASTDPGSKLVMTIDGGGAVGIGTSNPAHTLDVVGDANFSTQLAVGTNLVVTGKANIGTTLGVGVATPTQTLDLSGGASFRNGSTANPQIALGYNGTPDYAHAIRTRHNGGGQAGNAIDFYVWNYGTDAADAIGTKQVMTLDGNGNVGIGTQSPAVMLDVEGGTTSPAFKLVDGTQHNGYVLTSDASGNATWQSSPVSTNIYNSDGTLTAARTVTMAGQALNFNGGQVITNFDMSINGLSVGSGNGSGTAGTTQSTIFGFAAVATGNDNTSIGFAAGNGASGSDNTSVGTNALRNSGTGSANTAIGSGAGGNHGGNNNTFLGDNAITTGSFSNATAIGSNASVGASNSLVLGSINGVNGATSSVKVGIGTSTPATALDVESTTSPAFKLVDGTQQNGYVLTSDASGNATWHFVTGTIANGNATGYTLFWNGSSWVNSKNIYNNGTNIAMLGASAGDTSIAIGNGASSSGQYSTAIGVSASATNTNTLALGNRAIASGNTSTAIGNFSTASGDFSTALGSGSTASGKTSFAFGRNLTAASFSETALGSGNTAYTPSSTTAWVTTDRLFGIGNGDPSTTTTSDAMVILKNGNTGFGVSSPGAKVEVSGLTKTTTLQVTTGAGTGKVLTSDASGNATWQTATNPGSHAVGDYYGGGVVFWVDPTGTHGLICAVTDQSNSAPWCPGTPSGSTNTYVFGNALFAGATNTAAIIGATAGLFPNNSTTYAARICNEYSVNVSFSFYGGWYLPSLYELQLMYNNASTINAVAAANGGSDFTAGNYWSSVEAGGNNGDFVNFTNGSFSSTAKNTSYNVRAVRAF